MADIARAQKRPQSSASEFLTPPLVVMNNFGTAPQFELAATMFKGLFPAINVHTTKLSDVSILFIYLFITKMILVEDN